MTIDTRFGLGDTVFYATTELIQSDEVCEACGREKPGRFGPLRAVEAVVTLIKIQVYQGRIDIWYDVSPGGDIFREEFLFATAEEALSSRQG